MWKKLRNATKASKQRPRAQSAFSVSSDLQESREIRAQSHRRRSEQEVQALNDSHLWEMGLSESEIRAMGLPSTLKHDFSKKRLEEKERKNNASPTSQSCSRSSSPARPIGLDEIRRKSHESTSSSDDSENISISESELESESDSEPNLQIHEDEISGEDAVAELHDCVKAKVVEERKGNRRKESNVLIDEEHSVDSSNTLAGTESQKSYQLSGREKMGTPEAVLRNEEHAHQEILSTIRKRVDEKQKMKTVAERQRKERENQKKKEKEYLENTVCPFSLFPTRSELHTWFQYADEHNIPIWERNERFRKWNEQRLVILRKQQHDEEDADLAVMATFTPHLVSSNKMRELAIEKLGHLTLYQRNVLFDDAKEKKAEKMRLEQHKVRLKCEEQEITLQPSLKLTERANQEWLDRSPRVTLVDRFNQERKMAREEER